jgi:GT2 family glycosyltransferase
MSITTSVVIPCYNHWEFTHSLLFDLYKNSDIPDEVIVMDDCSTDSMVADGIRFWTDKRMLPVTHYRQAKNQGFLKTSNAGIEYADGDVVILLSNDVSIQDNLVKDVLAKLEQNKKCLVGASLYSQSTGWNEFDGRIFPYLSIFILAFYKETWKELGGFDERFCPNDYEDVDLCTTALDRGYVLATLDNPKYIHKVAGTIGFNPERQALTERNREKFRQKWLTK